MSSRPAAKPVHALLAALLLVAGCGELGEREPVRRYDGSAADADSLDAGSSDDGETDTGPADLDASDVVDTADATSSETVDGGGADSTYTVAVVSDMNSSYGSTTYLDEVHRAVDFVTEDLEPDLALSAGDMVAGQKEGLDYRAMWTAFHSSVTEEIRSSGIPFAPTPGNHDASGYPAFEEERNTYIDEWKSRRPNLDYVEDTYFPLRYAFRLGPALFVSLDDTTVGPLGEPQMRWLETVLQENADAPVKVVYGHLPLWGFAQGRADEVIGDPDLERLLESHGVDLFVSGHHHAYYPGKRGDIRMLSMACLGAGPRELLGTDRTSDRSVAVFRYDRRGIRSIDAYRPPNFDRPIDRSLLPAMVDDGDAVVVRDHD